MKITAWKLVAEYEDGHEEDISTYVRGRLSGDIENLLDSLEEEENAE
jgi:hypothetical protein